ncbi:MAG: DUF4397 domain-containing protein [Gammaproteobacteria bacterium]|nr:DUF4397 domain-containing protein [Gammaproteobacteria bacterium]
MKATALTSGLMMAAALMLSACGGSSKDDSVTADSYLQFYNAAANTDNTMLSVADTSVGSATYGDVSSVKGFTAGSYTLLVKDVNSSASLLSKELALSTNNKTLFILTQQGQQYDYLTLDVSQAEPAESSFNLQLVNLSALHDQIDIYVAEAGNGFAGAQKLDTLSQHEASTAAVNKTTGQYQFYLATAGSDTPFFSTELINFAYQNNYVVLVRDKFGPVAGQLALDVVLNSSTATSFDDVDATAQFRLYNSLSTDITLALDNTVQVSVGVGQLSDYVATDKGDYSLSVRGSNDNLLLNSALLSLAAGDSKAVLLYQDAQGSTEALAITENSRPQQKSHDVIVANLVADFTQLQFYFVRQNETIATAKYHVKNLAFKKQQTLSLPLDYYAIALVHVAENGSTTLLDKTDVMQLTPGQHYMLLAEQDAAAPSGYKVKLVH